jgi:hypothetical protein
MKTCIKCKQPKSLSEFPKRRGAKDGTRNECEVCYSTRVNKWAKENSYKHQNSYYHKYGKFKAKHKREVMSEEELELKNLKNRLYKYDLSVSEYEKMIASQDNKCAICNKEFTKTPYIDHDHFSGAIRELLCPSCNFILGFCNDNVTILDNCISYLRKHGILES